MLTKSDLSQIQKIVHSEITVELEPVKKDVSSLKEDVGVLKKDVKTLRKDMRYVKKTIKVMVPFFNEEDVQLQKRIRRIEEHLALST